MLPFLKNHAVARTDATAAHLSLTSSAKSSFGQQRAVCDGPHNARSFARAFSCECWSLCSVAPSGWPRCTCRSPWRRVGQGIGHGVVLWLTELGEGASMCQGSCRAAPGHAATTHGQAHRRPGRWTRIEVHGAMSKRFFDGSPGSCAGAQPPARAAWCCPLVSARPRRLAVGWGGVVHRGVRACSRSLAPADSRNHGCRPKGLRGAHHATIGVARRPSSGPAALTKVLVLRPEGLQHSAFVRVGLAQTAKL